MTGVLIEKFGQRFRYTEYHVAIKEEVSIMLPQSKEHQGLLTSPRNKERERGMEQIL